MSNFIGKNVREIRIMSGMTGEELADSAGVSKSAVSMLENGKRGGSIDTALKIAKALNMTVEDLAKEWNCGHVELVRTGVDDDGLVAKCIHCGDEFTITER